MKARLIAKLQALWPNSAFCQRCRIPYRACANGYHITHLPNGTGVFPLCNDCWRRLGSAKKRLPYYRMIFKTWTGPDETEWDMIEEAVRSEDDKAD